MGEYIKKNIQLQILAVFLAMPALIWVVSNTPQRTLLKDGLSIATLLAFSLMIALFYLARTNPLVTKKVRFGRLLRWHRRVGYLVLPVLLIHPLLLVVPRYFEAGIDPVDALKTILTTFTSSGLLYGFFAWGFALVLGLTALLRKKLPLNYQTWRTLHGVLALLSLLCAVLHMTDLGRHAGGAMNGFFLLISAGGLWLLLKNSLVNQAQMGENNEN